MFCLYSLDSYSIKTCDFCTTSYLHSYQIQDQTYEMVPLILRSSHPNKQLIQFLIDKPTVRSQRNWGQMANHNHDVCYHTKVHCGHHAHSVSVVPLSFPHPVFYPKPFLPRGFAVFPPASLLYVLAMYSIGSLLGLQLFS